MSNTLSGELKEMAQAALKEINKAVGHKTYEDGCRATEVKYLPILERVRTEHAARVSEFEVKMRDAEHRIRAGTAANENLQTRLQERTTELATTREKLVAMTTENLTLRAGEKKSAKKKPTKKKKDGT